MRFLFVLVVTLAVFADAPAGRLNGMEGRVDVCLASLPGEFRGYAGQPLHLRARVRTAPGALVRLDLPWGVRLVLAPEGEVELVATGVVLRRGGLWLAARQNSERSPGLVVEVAGADLQVSLPAGGRPAAQVWIDSLAGTAPRRGYRAAGVRWRGRRGRSTGRTSRGWPPAST